MLWPEIATCSLFCCYARPHASRAGMVGPSVTSTGAQSLLLQSTGWPETPARMHPLLSVTLLAAVCLQRSSWPDANA